MNIRSNSDTKNDKDDYFKHISDLNKYLAEKSDESKDYTEYETNRRQSLQQAIKRMSSYKTRLNNSRQVESKLLDLFAMKTDCELMNQFSYEPVKFFPDMNLWLMCDGRPMGICTLDANSIIWSDLIDERGAFCGKTVYADVKVIKNKYLYNVNLMYFIIFS